VATGGAAFAADAAGLSGHHFLTNDQRAHLTSATIGLGAIGAAAGGAGLATAPPSAADIAEDVTATAADQTKIAPEDPRVWGDGQGISPAKRYALEEEGNPSADTP